MFQRLGLINKKQRGFTLVELLVVIAISGLITGGVTTAVYQTITGNTRTSNHMTAIRQVQDAGYWVSHNAQMAQNLATSDTTTGFPITLNWTEWDGTGYVVTFNINAGQLERQRVVYDSSGNEIENTTSIIARYIDPGNTICALVYAFQLPDVGDKFRITNSVGSISGTIVVTQGSVTAQPTGSATVAGGTAPVTINPASGAVAWTISNSGDTVIIDTSSTNTIGIWTSTVNSATAGIVTDSDYDTTVATRPVLVFTVTVKIGTGSQEASETRVYEVIPKPSL